MMKQKNKRSKKIILFLFYFFQLNVIVCADNLIKNSGFEEESKSAVPYWSLFIQPQDGSFGKVDKKIYHTGKNSILLNNTNNYQKEPLNNWSQRIPINSSDYKDIYLEGWIKTDNVHKAYILLQFWRQNPARIIDSTTSEILSETNEWKKVNITTKIPEETDFCVIRCAIEGTGCAWFDDLLLNYGEKNVEEIKEDLIPTKNENKNLEEGIKKIEQRLEELLKENTQLKNKINLLEEENKKIREKLEKINDNPLDKKDITIQEKEPEKPAEFEEKVPILVPHKKNWRSIKKEQE